jgi:hypothetical protein
MLKRGLKLILKYIYNPLLQLYYENIFKNNIIFSYNNKY